MPRGRPRTKNPDQVLYNVLKTFWEKGYSETSLSDLVAASGMAKAGLYVNFGDKETLYAKSLDLYVSRIALPMLEEVSNPDLPLRDAIGGFLVRIASTALQPDGPKGCLVALSLMDVQSLPEGLRSKALSRNAQRKDVFLSRLRHASEQGILAPGGSVGDLANFYSAQALAVTSLARGGEAFENIQTVIRQSLQLLPDAG